jgi:hypothetical protein
VVGTLTATYGEQSGQDLGPSGAGLVYPWDQRERERERSVVNAVTSTIQYGADDSTAQAGHLIVEEKS